MGLSAVSATDNSDLGISGDFWGDGVDSAQKLDTLAGRQVSSAPGKRLAEARRGHDPPLHIRMHTPAHTHAHTNADTQQRWPHRPALGCPAQPTLCCVCDVHGRASRNFPARPKGAYSCAAGTQEGTPGAVCVCACALTYYVYVNMCGRVCVCVCVHVCVCAGVPVMRLRCAHLNLFLASTRYVLIICVHVGGGVEGGC